MNVYLQKNFPFDPKIALAPVATAADVLLVLAVNAVVPVKTVPELIEYAKKNADKKLSYGSAGIGSAHHIAGELLKQKTGIDMLHVPYRGGGPAIQDLVAGHIPISFGTTPAVLPQANAGTVRILALVEAKRSPDLPGVPTVAETVPDVVTMTWLGLFAPAGTPEPIMTTLRTEVQKIMARPDFAQKLNVSGSLEPLILSPADFAALIGSDYEKYGKLTKELGIKLD
jgi:tripartite-type tricarboxylate transporter receptor subunit TctC